MFLKFQFSRVFSSARASSGAIKRTRKPSSASAARNSADFVSPRKMAFKGVSQVMDLCNANRYLDAVKFVFGRDASRILSEQQLEKLKNISRFSGDMKGYRRIPGLLQSKRPEIWNVLIDRMAKRGFYEEAFQLFHRMKERKIHPTPETFTSLFRSCSQFISTSSSGRKANKHKKKNAYQKALRLFYSMKLEQLDNRNIQISRAHVNAMLQCSSHAKDWEKMFEIYGEMCRPNSPMRKHEKITVEDFISEYRQKKREERRVEEGQVISSAADTLPEWMSTGKTTSQTEGKPETNNNIPTTANSPISLIYPDNITYNILISACSRRGGQAAFKDAELVWKDLVADARSQSIAGQTQTTNETSPKKKSEIQLDEDEYLAWMKFEQEQTAVAQTSPSIQIDTQLVNSMLLSCSNSDMRSGHLKAFEYCRRELIPLSMCWSMFQQWLKTTDNSSSNLLGECKEISNSVKSSSRKDPNERYSLAAINLPDSKTLSIMMNLLEKKLQKSPLLVSKYYEYHTKHIHSHLRIHPDLSLNLYYLKLLLKSNELEMTTKQALKLKKTLSKSRVLSPAGHSKKLVPIKCAPPPELIDILMESSYKSGDTESVRKLWAECKDYANRSLQIMTSSNLSSLKSFEPSSTRFLPSLKSYLTYLGVLLQSDNIKDQESLIDSINRLKANQIVKGEEDSALACTNWKQEFYETKCVKSITLWKLGMAALLKIDKEKTKSDRYQEYLKMFIMARDSK